MVQDGDIILFRFNVRGLFPAGERKGIRLDHMGARTRALWASIPRSGCE